MRLRQELSGRTSPISLTCHNHHYQDQHSTSDNDDNNNSNRRTSFSRKMSTPIDDFGCACPENALGISLSESLISQSSFNTGADDSLRTAVTCSPVDNVSSADLTDSCVELMQFAADTQSDAVTMQQHDVFDNDSGRQSARRRQKPSVRDSSSGTSGRSVHDPTLVQALESTPYAKQLGLLSPKVSRLKNVMLCVVRTIVSAACQLLGIKSGKPRY